MSHKLSKSIFLKVLKNLMFLLFYLSTYQINAQEFLQLLQEDRISIKKLERVGEQYFKNRSKGKGSGYKLYMRNLYWAKRNVDANGYVINDNQVLEESKKFQNSLEKNTLSENIQRNNGWQELGPFEWTRTSSWNPGLGRIVSIAVEPTQQNIIYAGSPGGGIWKSNDAGKNWRPLGDQMINMSIWSIAIHPNDVNIVFAGNSAGRILKSTNGGTSWSQIVRVSGTPRRILIHPNGSTIFIGTTKALYRSVDGGSSFNLVLNDVSEDVDFKPGNTNIVYACGNRFYKSTNGGASFSRVSSGIVTNERMKMAVTPANPNAVYLVQKRGSSFGRLYRSLNSGTSFSIRADYNSVSTSDVYFTQARRDMAIAVSDSNVNEVHLGGMNYSRSLDGGVNFNTLSSWNTPNDRSYVHADIEVLHYVNGTIYVGSDGGIFRSTNRGNNTTDLTQRGLAVRQYYRIGGAATDANMIVGGAQDNGTNIMNGSDRQFKEWLGADGMECFIDHKNKNIVYGTTQFGTLYKSTNGGNSIGNISKPGNFSGEWVTPFMMDPIDNKSIYVGYNNLYRSRNGGSNGSWRNITSSINIGGGLDEMAIAKSNNNYIYIANRGRVWRTKNGQSSNPSWTEVSNFSGEVNFINVDPNNPERVAIAATGSRVYVSVNAGNSWSNRSSNLPNISAQCLMFDDTASNGLYVGMQSGVYYTNDNLDGWISFSKNLPGTQTTDLEIHYPTRKLRVATYGRGIWESNLYEEADNELNPPSDLIARVEDKNIILSWKDNTSIENGFTIERSNGGAYEQINYVGRNTQTYTDENMQEGTYSYRVRTYDATVYSDYSNIATAVIEDIITPPDIIDNCEGCIVYDTDSEETVNDDLGKEKAADGDPNTYWHTNWYDDNTTHPHFITIDLGQQRDLLGFSYQGRQTGTTGMVKDYVLFGWDGSRWQELSRGSFQKSTLKQTVDFDAFTCRYLYFRALSEVDEKRWTSVAEFTVRYKSTQNLRTINDSALTNNFPPTVDLDQYDDIKVFPIPFVNALTIKTTNSKKIRRSIKLVGLDGRTFHTTSKVEGDQIKIDTESLPKGIYVLSFIKDNRERTLHVLKSE